MFFGPTEFTQKNMKNLANSTLKKLQNQKEFLIYLDGEGILKELQINANNYEKNCRKSLKKGNFIPPFRFQLKLDILKIQEVSEDLIHLFKKETDAGMDLATNVIFCGVNLLLENLTLHKFDLQIIPLVINLPITCEISDLLRCPSFELECVQGVLMSKTTVTKYVRSSVYSCELNYCPGNKLQRYPRNLGNVCPHCLSLMEEDVSSSDSGEEFICQIVSLKAYRDLGRFQVLNVRVKDELCTSSEFCIGEEYKITGKLNENFFEALNVAPKSFLPALNFSSTLPKSILNLYHKISSLTSNCPWSFVSALSSPLGSHLIPVSSFLHLKMGLLLSLSSQKSDQPPTPLVAIGSDSLNVQHLFHSAGQLAERYVKYSASHSYLGGIAKPGLHTDTVCMEAGQLTVAAKGICNLGDWSKFKKEQTNYIFQTIESGQIVLHKGKLGKSNLTDFLPLKCAVWTFWCHITTSRSHQLQLKTLINEQDLESLKSDYKIHTTFSVFGIPFLAEEKNELEVEKICLKNLEKGKKKSDSNPNTISPRELKDFIKIINTRELGLSDSASSLIRNYFVVSRRDRPHCLPVAAIKTITSLAEAHARLALRDEVQYEDAVAVIYLYEESISALFGESIIPYSKLVWNQEEPIFVFVGKQLQQFKIWLEEYISH